jgi:deazaflavin-dependent oxidoreductase (nitroreductase family)
MAHAPAVVRFSNPLASRLLRLGLPLGPNVILTVRGRVSGQPRSFPVAILAHDGRRYVIGAYGDVQWTRNLRAAGEAELSERGAAPEHVLADELSRPEAERFFAETLPSFIGQFSAAGRLFAKVFFRLAAPDIVTDPVGSAAKRPVFELRRSG